MIKEGDNVLICLEDGSTFLVKVEQGKKLATHKGIVELSTLIGQNYGCLIKLSKASAYVVEPSIEDYIMKVERRTNIVYPKDIGIILLSLNVHCGAKVVEIGTGSGALTIALAFAVAPFGKVYSFDVREDHLLQAQKNLQKAGLLEYVHLQLKQKNHPVGIENVDAVILDIASPWEEVDTAKRCLKPGGRLASLNPTFNQIEQMAECLRQNGFILIRAMEVICRPILARLGKTRPAQQIIAHTEFLITAVYPGGQVNG